MKITSISVFQVDLPFSGAIYRLSGGREYRNFDATVLRIETDAGVEGWGESTPFGSNYIAAHARGVRAGIAEIAPELAASDSSVAQLVADDAAEGVDLKISKNGGRTTSRRQRDRPLVCLRHRRSQTLLCRP